MTWHPCLVGGAPASCRRCVDVSQTGMPSLAVPSEPCRKFALLHSGLPAKRAKEPAVDCRLSFISDECNHPPQKLNRCACHGSTRAWQAVDDNAGSIKLRKRNRWQTHPHEYPDRNRWRSGTEKKAWIHPHRADDHGSDHRHPGRHRLPELSAVRHPRQALGGTVADDGYSQPPAAIPAGQSLLRDQDPVGGRWLRTAQ
ncbi:hypothetical protein D3C81_1660480 [compost metagenome]